MSLNDDSIISLQFDGESFQRNVNIAMTSLSALTSAIGTFTSSSASMSEKVKTAFSSVQSVSNALATTGNGLATTLANATNSVAGFIDKITNRSKDVDMSPISEQVETVQTKFSAWGSLVEGIFIKLGMQITEFAENTLSKLTVDQISSGWQKYAQIMRSTQTTLATGADYGDTQEALRQLAWYADETSYALTDMTSAISKFTSYGIDIKDAAQEIMGVDNAVAKAGGTIAQGSSALMAFQRAFSMGYMSLSVWRRQLTTSGLITKDFKEQCIAAGLEVGTLYKDVNGVVKAVNGDIEVTATGMENTLTKTQWMSRDVMETMLKGYSASTLEIEALYQEFAGDLTTSEILAINDELGFLDEYSVKAFKLAQEATTLSQAIDALWDTTSTQYEHIFEQIFGGYKQSKKLWTEVANWLIETFDAPVYAMVDWLSDFNDACSESLISWDEFTNVTTASKEELEQTFGTTEHNAIAYFFDSIMNVMSAITSYIDVFKLAWSSVFDSLASETAVGFLKSWHNFTEDIILSGDQIVALASGLQKVFMVFKAMLVVLKDAWTIISDGIWPIIKSLITYAVNGLKQIMSYISELTSGRFTKWLESVVGEVKNVKELYYSTMATTENWKEKVLKAHEEYQAELKKDEEATDDLTTSTKEVAEVFSNLSDKMATIDIDNITQSDIDALRDLVSAVESSEYYMSDAETAATNLSDALDSIADTGYATSDDISDWNEMIDTMAASLKSASESSEEFNALQKKSNEINKDSSKVTKDTVNELKNLTSELKNSDMYVDSTTEKSQEFDDKLKEIKEDGKITADEIEELNDIIKELGDTLDDASDSADDFEPLRNAIKAIGDTKIDDSTISNLKTLTNTLYDSSLYLDDSQLAASKFEEQLESISKTGQITADDIEELNELIDQMNSSMYASQKYRTDANDKAAIMLKTLQSFEADGIITEAELNTLQKLQTSLENTTGYTNDTAVAIDALEASLTALASGNGEVSASDIESISSAIETLNEAAENDNGYNKKISTYNETVESMQTLVESISETGKATKADVEEFKTLYNTLVDTTGGSAELTRSYNQLIRTLNKATMRTGLSEEQIESLSTLWETFGNSAVDAMDKLDEKTKETEKSSTAIKRYSDAVYEVKEDLKTEATQAETTAKTVSDSNKTVSKSTTKTAKEVKTASETVKDANTSVTKSTTETTTKTTTAVKDATESVNQNASKTSKAVEEANETITGTTNESTSAVSRFVSVCKEAANAITSLTKSNDDSAKALSDSNENVATSTSDAATIIKNSTNLITDMEKDVEDIDAEGTATSISSIFSTITQSITNGIAEIKETDSTIEKQDGKSVWSTLVDGLADISESTSVAETISMSVVALAGLAVLAENMSTIVAYSPEIIASAGSTFKYLGEAVLAAGLAIGIIAYVDGKYGTASNALNSLSKMLDVMNQMLVVELLSMAMHKEADLEAVSAVFVAIGSCMISAAIAIAAVSYLDKEYGNTQESAESILKLLKSISSLVSVIYVFSKESKNNVLGYAAILVEALGACLLEMAASLAIVMYVDNKYGGCIDAAKALKKVIDEMGDLLAKLVVFGNDKDCGNLLVASATVAAMGAAAIELGKAIEIICEVYSDNANSEEAVKGLKDLMHEMEDAVKTILIFGEDDEYPQLLAASATFGALGGAMIEIGKALEIMAEAFSGEKSSSYKKACDEAKDLMHEMEDAVKTILIFGEDDEYPQLTAASATFGAMGAAMIEVGKALEIMADVFDRDSITQFELSCGAINDILHEMEDAVKTILIFGEDDEYPQLTAASATFGAMGAAMIEVGKALEIISNVFSTNKTKSVKAACNALDDLLHEMEDAIKTILIFGEDDESPQLAAATLTYVGLGESSVQIAQAVEQIAQAFTNTNKTAFENAVTALDVIIHEMEDAIKTILIFGEDDEYPQLLAASLTYATLAGVMLAIAEACDAICQVYDEYGHVGSFILTVKCILEEMEECVNSVIIFAGLFKVKDIKAAGEVFAAVGAALLELTAAIGVITYLNDKYGAAKVKKATDQVLEILDEVSLIIAGLEAVSIIGKNKYSADKIKALAYPIAALAVPILAATVAIGLICDISAKYSAESVNNAADTVLKMLDALEDIAYAFAFAQFGDIDIASAKVNILSFGNDSEAWLGQLGIAVIALGAAVAIIAAIYDLYPTSAKEAADCVVDMLIAVGVIACVLALLADIPSVAKVISQSKSAFAGKWGSILSGAQVNIKNETDFTGVANLITSIGATVDLLAGAVAAMCIVSDKYGENFNKCAFTVIGMLVLVGILSCFIVGLTTAGNIAEIMSDNQTAVQLGNTRIDLKNFKSLFKKNRSTTASNLKAASTVIVSIGAAVDELAAAMWIMAKAHDDLGDDFDSVLWKLIGYTAGIAIFAGCMTALCGYESTTPTTSSDGKALTGGGKKFKVSAVSLAAASAVITALGATTDEFAAAVWIISKAYDSLGDLTEETMDLLIAVVISCGLLAVELCKVSSQADKGALAITAGVITALGAAMDEFAIALGIIAYAYSFLDPNQNTFVVSAGSVGSLVVIAGAVAELAKSLVSEFGGKGNQWDFVAIGAMFMEFGAALNEFATALGDCCEIIDKYDPDVTTESLGSLAGAIAAFGGVAYALGKVFKSNEWTGVVDHIVGAGTLIALAESLKIFTDAMDEMTDVCAKDLNAQGERKIKGIGTVGGACAVMLGYLVVAIGAMAIAGKVLEGAATGVLLFDSALLAISLSLWLAAKAFEVFTTAWLNFKKGAFGDNDDDWNNQYSRMSSQLTDNVNEIKKTAQDTKDGYVNGLTMSASDKEKLKYSVNTWGSTTTDTLKENLDVNSPSRKMKEIGEYALEGYILGLGENVNDVASAGESIGTASLNAISKVVENNRKSEGLTKATISLADNMATCLGEEFDSSVTDLVADAISNTFGLVKDLSEEDLSIQPLITPVVDMDSFDQASLLMSSLENTDTSVSSYVKTTRGTATGIQASLEQASLAASQLASTNETISDTTSSNGITYIQNNYSPKSLSQTEIYRQTRNQLSGAVGRKMPSGVKHYKINS